MDQDTDYTQEQLVSHRLRRNIWANDYRGDTSAKTNRNQDNISTRPPVKKAYSLENFVGIGKDLKEAKTNMYFEANKNGITKEAYSMDYTVILDGVYGTTEKDYSLAEKSALKIKGVKNPFFKKRTLQKFNLEVEVKGYFQIKQ